MKKITNFSIVTLLVFSFVFLAAAPNPNIVRAATSPSLGAAATFAILADTFTRNIGVTTIVGDLGYTTLSGGGSHTITGTTYVGGGVGNATYQQAGIDQGSALTALAAQACTFTFADGPIDLAADTTHGPVGVYTPGVYCTGAASAASIGTGGITLNGAGTYIFRINGAFTTVDNSIVTLSGSSACDVFWTPTAATTLGANSTFKGTNIDASGITVGSTVNWEGRALAFGGTVTADVDTITAPTCAAAPASSSSNTGTINVVKNVVNDSGGTRVVADFPLFVNGTPVVSGETNTFSTSGGFVYSVTETNSAGYTQSFSGDCDANGQMNLNRGDNKFCIITNNDIGTPAPVVPPLINVVKVPSPLSLPGGPGSVTYTYTLYNTGTVPVTDVTMIGDTCSSIVRVSGDTNSDNKLDVSETWVYTCSTTLTETHTNIITATGWANGISAVDVANATVVVGEPIEPPLINVTKVPDPLVLVSGGGTVAYTYRITNPGEVALSNVQLTDDKCSPMYYVSGNTNGNSMLDTDEVWIYTCSANLTATTTNTVIARGEANGLVARDIAVATVVVAIPTLPDTGLEGNTSWNVILPAGILTILTLLYFARRKQTA